MDNVYMEIYEALKHFCVIEEIVVGVVVNNYIAQNLWGSLLEHERVIRNGVYTQLKREWSSQSPGSTGKVFAERVALDALHYQATGEGRTG